MANEKKTDIFISRLLEKSNIDYETNGSKIKEIKEALKSSSKRKTGKQGYPEFVGISKDFIIVIENKSDLSKHENYEEENKLLMNQKSITDYALNGALHYARIIYSRTNFKKIFAFGCSGNEKHHRITPIFLNEKGYKILDDVENFENFEKENIENYYNEQVLGKTPKSTLELEEILKKSEELHEHLRNYGQLREQEKPLVVSAILLALSEKSFNKDLLIGDEFKKDGEKIYEAIETYMKRVQVEPEIKKERILHQFTLIKDRPILNRVDIRLGKTPLKYFLEFLENSIFETIKSNTPEDILGRFYGEFIKYSGGDGQSLGVVLTPSHITSLFCDLIDLKPNDVIFDPCCGTGGFLITAMHDMLNKAKGKQKESIKKNQIHGIEIREDMFSIATTNMILRGDGKSNLLCNDFFDFSVDDLRKKKFTVGFMNPPYSQSKNKDTEHLSELEFIKYLLDSLDDNGRCVVIVPQSTMTGKNKSEKLLKKEILKKHTLEGVITLNKETFYRVGTHPCIAVFTAHNPHPTKKYCKFINFENDGYEIKKHIGIIETEKAKEKKKHLLSCWKYDEPAESKFMVKSTIEPDDEWLHSFYYFNDEIPSDEDFEKTVSEYLTFEFSMIMENREYLFKDE